MQRYNLLFNTPHNRNVWGCAARGCEWTLLLGMVRLWRKANPNCQLQAVRSRHGM